MDVEDGEEEREEHKEELVGPPCLAERCPRRVAPGSPTEVRHRILAVFWISYNDSVV